jgi:hypothetical protein
MTIPYREREGSAIDWLNEKLDSMVEREAFDVSTIVPITPLEKPKRARRDAIDVSAKKPVDLRIHVPGGTRLQNEAANWGMPCTVELRDVHHEQIAREHAWAARQSTPPAPQNAFPVAQRVNGRAAARGGGWSL